MRTRLESLLSSLQGRHAGAAGGLRGTDPDSVLDISQHPPLLLGAPQVSSGNPPAQTRDPGRAPLAPVGAVIQVKSSPALIAVIGPELVT